MQDDPPGHFRRQLDPAATERLSALIRELIEHRREVDFYNAGLGFLLLSAWTAFQDAEHAPAELPVHPAIEKAVRLIQQETTPLTLEAIAAEVGLSSSRLAYLFRRDVGTSLLTFRDQRRIERFLKLHGDGAGRTMLEASLAAGFGSYPQFHRVFRQVMGCAPSRYRRKSAPPPAPLPHRNGGGGA